MNRLAKINGGLASKLAARTNRPSRKDVEQAVSTLIRRAGDDPDRDGSLATSGRVASAYEGWLAGYADAITAA